MLNKWISWLKRVLLPSSDNGNLTLDKLQWHIPKKEQWPLIEVFTATGLFIGRGIVEISKDHRVVFIRDVIEQHFTDAHFKSNGHHGYQLPMQSKDYSKTKVLCILDISAIDENTFIDDVDNMVKTWRFQANELYWEHPGHGIIPFFDDTTGR